MTPQEVVAIASDAMLLDVREVHEYAAGHIADAVHIPMGQLAARQGELPVGTPIVCVCRSGSRSAAVVQALATAGYEAHNLDGGVLAWRAAGMPLQGADGGPGTIF